MRHDLHSNRPPSGFRRMTLSNNQLASAAVVLNERGYVMETVANAGPGVLDYTALHAVDGIGDGAQQGLHLDNRELTIVLCDGRLMGPQERNDYPIGSDSPQRFREWDDCEWAVFQDLEWEIIIARPEPRDTPRYRSQRITVPGDDDEKIIIPGLETDLEEYLDAQVVGAVEAEGGDVWFRRSNALKAPYALTLMRCPIDSGDQETSTDMNEEGVTDDPSTPLGLAPIGMLLRDHWDNLTGVLFGGTIETPTQDYPGTNYTPSSWLEGTSEWNQNGAQDSLTVLRNQQYRPWEPYDDLTNVIIRREMHTLDFSVPNNDNVQDVMFLDDDVTDGYEPAGNEAFPQMSHGSLLYRFRGRHEGPFVVSANNPEPLVLHLAGLPVLLRTYIDADGKQTWGYYRPTIIPVRINVTANVKMR